MTDILSLDRPASAAPRPAMLPEMPSLIGLTREEMGRALAEVGVAERQVKMRRLLLGRVHAQGRLTLRAELDAVRPLLDDSYAERFERREEERSARCIVADSEFDVVKHQFS